MREKQKRRHLLKGWVASVRLPVTQHTDLSAVRQRGSFTPGPSVVLSFLAP